LKKTLHKLFLLIFSGILSFTYSFAQQDFRSGYIITNTSDTINGLLLYKSFDTYNKCTVKINPEDKVIHYKPGEIRAFRFNDSKYFISKEIPTETGNKTVFLEYLIQGKANIYFYQDGIEHYYIETDKDKITELSESVENLDRTSVKKSFYKGKLRYMLSKCPEIYPEIDRMSLDGSDLIKLAKDYHEKVCTSEQCIIFERKDKSIQTNVEFLAGASLNRFYFNTGVNTNFALGELAGCNVEIENLFFSLEHTSLQLGLFIQRFQDYSISSNRKNLRYNRSGDTDKIENVELNAIALKLPVTINHSFLAGKFRPYIGFGVTNTFIIYQNMDVTAIWGGERFGIFTRQADVLDNFSGGIIHIYQVGALGKIGTKYLLKNDNYFFMEVNCELSQDIVVNATKNSNIFLVAGYGF
jgi:hypothetical protein